MVYAALTNWKYDKNLYHKIQSGPQRTGDNLNLTDTYGVINSGYITPWGEQQTYYTIFDQGADFGIITPGPPQEFVDSLGKLPYPNLPQVLGYKVTMSYPDPPGFEFGFIPIGDVPSTARSFGPGPVPELGRPLDTTFYTGSTYVFDTSDPALATHPLYFSSTPDGTWGGGVEWTEGVERSAAPAGTEGSFVLFTPPVGTPLRMYIYCPNHQQVGEYSNLLVNNPPIKQRWYQSDNWRAVPPAMSGFWAYGDATLPYISGALTARDGFRGQFLYKTANSTVQSTLGPEYGLIRRPISNWYQGQCPSNQQYSPFQTPGRSEPVLDNRKINESKTTGKGSTGGGQTHTVASQPSLICITPNDTSGSRTAWKYHAPVYCDVHTQVTKVRLPGQTGTIYNRMYRGKSAFYAQNYASIYGVQGEGIRGIIRTFSATVNSSNQPNFKASSV